MAASDTPIRYPYVTLWDRGLWRTTQSNHDFPAGIVISLLWIKEGYIVVHGQEGKPKELTRISNGKTHRDCVAFTGCEVRFEQGVIAVDSTAPELVPLSSGYFWMNTDTPVKGLVVDVKPPEGKKCNLPTFEVVGFSQTPTAEKVLAAIDHHLCGAIENYISTWFELSYTPASISWPGAVEILPPAPTPCPFLALSREECESATSKFEPTPDSETPKRISVGEGGLNCVPFCESKIYKCVEAPLKDVFFILENGCRKFVVVHPTVYSRELVERCNNFGRYVCVTVEFRIELPSAEDDDEFLDYSYDYEDDDSD